MLAREAGVSEATVSRVLAGHPVRGLTVLRMVQALRRNPAIPELVDLVVVGTKEAPKTKRSAPVPLPPTALARRVRRSPEREMP
jgi:hypothetical protein